MGNLGLIDGNNHLNQDKLVAFSKSSLGPHTVKNPTPTPAINLPAYNIPTVTPEV
jgi:hypothetical protein